MVTVDSDLWAAADVAKPCKISALPAHPIISSSSRRLSVARSGPSPPLLSAAVTASVIVVARAGTAPVAETPPDFTRASFIDYL